MRTQDMNSDHFNRRNFITRAARGAVALTFAGAATRFARSQEESPNEEESPTEESATAEAPAVATGDRVGFALVGLGRLSIQQLIPAFVASKKAKLTALVSGDAAKAQRIAAENGVDPKSIYNYKNFGRIAKNKDVQVVYIVLPNSMHAEFTVRAARAGKHVLCEKPMEVSVTKCQQMISECRHAKVKLMVAYRVQYDPRHRAMQRLVREKAFGDVKYIESANLQKVKEMEWRLSEKLSGSGAVGDLGVYCINTIRFLLGEEPIEIYAQTFRPSGNPLFKEVDAMAVWQMRFPSGLLANCSCSFDAHDTKSYRVVADRGTFGMDPAFPYQGLKMFQQPNEPALPNFPDTNQFIAEIDHMADCVLNNREPYTPGEEGLQDQRIIEAIFESAKKQRIVKLPKIDKLDAFRGPELRWIGRSAGDAKIIAASPPD
jgi:predicted dehydrogenase